MNDTLDPTTTNDERMDRLERIIGRVQQSEDGEVLRAIEMVLDDHLRRHAHSA